MSVSGTEGASSHLAGLPFVESHLNIVSEEKTNQMPCNKKRRWKDETTDDNNCQSLTTKKIAISNLCICTDSGKEAPIGNVNVMNCAKNSTVLEKGKVKLFDELLVDKIVVNNKDYWLEYGHGEGDLLYYRLGTQNFLHIDQTASSWDIIMKHDLVDAKTAFANSKEYPPDLGSYLAEKAGWPEEKFADREEQMFHNEYWAIELKTSMSGAYSRQEIFILLIRNATGNVERHYYKTFAASEEARATLKARSALRRHMQTVNCFEKLGRTLSTKKEEPVYLLVENKESGRSQFLSMFFKDGEKIIKSSYGPTEDVKKMVNALQNSIDMNACAIKSMLLEKDMPSLIKKSENDQKKWSEKLQPLQYAVEFYFLENFAALFIRHDEITVETCFFLAYEPLYFRYINTTLKEYTRIN